MTGYSKLLNIDLTSRRTWTEPTDSYRQFIGGRGLNVALLYKLLKPGTDPLGPENVLIFSTGPVAGTIAPSSARYNVSARSPMTGFHGDSNSGGYWSPELRAAGYDGIIIHGKADRPLYVFIENDEVKLLEAGGIWGLDVWQTSEQLKRMHHDPDLKILCIGPAGERLVRFACIMNDYGRAAGRTGMGAVMGSKNLKAIAVRGTKGVRVADMEAFTKVSRRIVDTIRQSRQYSLYHESGVIGHRGVEDYADNSPGIGILGFKYHSASTFPGWGKLGGKEWWKAHWVKLKGCSSCQMHCSHFYILQHGPMAGVMSEGIDGEAMAWMTCHVGGESKDVAAYGYSLMNRYGLDTQEMGSVIGLLMLLNERSVISDRDLKELKGGWLHPDWGDPETILSLVKMVAYRRGIGNAMAEGPYLFAKHLGNGAERHVLQNKGLSMGGGDRRPQRGAILNHMVSSRGPDHLRGSPSLEFYGYTGDESIQVDWDKYVGEPELFKYAVQLLQYNGKAPLVIFQEHLRTLSDAFGVCSFNYGNWPNTRIYPEDFAELFTASTGIPASGDDMTLAAKRIHNVEKAFNIREGWEREDDQPPDRWTKEKKEAGIYKGEYCDTEKFNVMLSEYYQRRGWNRDSGLLTRECLEGTGLKEMADDLERQGKLDESSGPWVQPAIAPDGATKAAPMQPAGKEPEYFGD